MESLRLAVVEIVGSGKYLNESAMDYSGAEWDPPHYTTTDFPGITTTVTTANYVAQFEICADALTKLHLIEMLYPGTFVDEAAWGIGLSGDPVSFSGDSCEAAWTVANGYWDDYADWEVNYDVFPEVWYGLGSTADLETPLWTIIGLGASANRAKYQADFDGHIGSAYVFLKLQVMGDGLPPGEPPVDVDEAWHRWTTVTSEDNRTPYAGDQEIEPPPAECPANIDKGWSLFYENELSTAPDGVRVIFDIPPIDVNGQGVCNLGDVGNDANEETENPPADPLPNTCGGGGPGGGGPPGGGNNPTRPGASGPSTGGEVGSAVGDNENKYAGWLESEAALNAALNGGDPSSDWPVNLTRGMKLESATDLVVPTRHGSFAVRRAYSSDGDMGGSNLLGHHWMFSLGAFLRTPVSGSVITLDGWPSDRVVNYTETGSGSGIWKPSGTSNQRITSSSLTIDGTAINVWTLEEPGSWKMHFYRDPSTEEYEGLLLAEEDAYGNLHTYQYALFGSGTPHARLVRILLDGTPENGSGASLVFNWYTGSPDATKGKLKSIQHYGLDSSGVSRLMNQVDYAYCTATSANQEGVAGDLVQVTRHTRLDKAPESTDSLFHPSVTLYRYHNGSEPLSNSDERLMAKGSLHQLKSVFNSEQIEFAAEELVTSGGQTWSADASVLEAAAYIRGLADSASLYTSSPRKVLDYASKIVSYADLSNGKVSHEYLQTSCGCAGSAHGTKLAFSYLSRGTDQPTTKVTESTESSGSYSAYRHTYYDMTKISGVPYLHTVAIVDAADTSKRWVTHIERNTSTFDVTRVVLPSAISTYRPVDDGSGYALTVSMSAGIVVGFDYNGEHRITETRIRNGDSATFSTFTLLKKFTYLT
ncbi:MAG: hypothetical protein IT432_00005, partial [Phycisphaerales bacterium]|nr:hypothetical protein [Phycisphaerales bacterium]